MTSLEQCTERFAGSVNGVQVIDDAELLKTSATMRVSEIRFRRLFEAAHDGVLILNSASRKITEANPFIANLLGYTRQELMGKELWEIGLLKDEAASHAAFRQLQHTGQIRYENLPLEAKSGETREVEVVANRYEEDGTQVIQCNVRDITVRKQTERALRESEERYRTLFDLGPVAVYSCDALGVIQRFNRRAAELWGRTPATGDANERFCGSTKLLHSDGTLMAHESCPMAELLSGKIAEVRDAEVVIERADGSRVIVVVNIRPLKNQDGAVTGAINCFYDITDRKRADEALRESEERYRMLFAAAPMALFVCDGNAVIQYYNRQAVELWGREPVCGVERFCGSTNRWLPDGTFLPQSQSPIVEVLRTGCQALNMEVAIERPDGSRLPVLMNFAALKNAQGEVSGAITSFTDITTRKVAEEALRDNETQIRALLEFSEIARLSAEAAKTRAETATRAKDDFLAALSHELRTPLSPALLLASALAHDAELPLRVRSDADIISKAIALQARLVDDLLDITRIASGKLRLDLNTVDAHSALRQSWQILLAEMEERQITFTLELDAREHHINADSVRMQQVFWNILKNAAKFTRPGGAITVKSCNLSGSEGILVIEISDTGIGIDPVMLPTIFDAFIQEEHDGEHRFGGLGLGLAITRKLVELHNGSIHAESPGRGRGATFHIELPLVAPVLCAINPSDSAMPAAAARQEFRILLVEDHELTRAALTRLLERRGHQVCGAATAAEARGMMGINAFDLIISDLGLPDIDGHTLMAEFRDAYGLPGIALSGYGMEQDLRRSLESGFYTHLTKPVDVQSLEAAIAAAPLGRNSKTGRE